MSPTRRDVLKSFAIATVAVALPQTVSAASFVRTVRRGDTEYPVEPIDDAICDQLGRFEELSNRIQREQWELQDRLAAHAETIGVWLEEEAPGAFVARRHGITGHCELVSASGCTCRRFLVFHRCEHHALVRRILDERGQS